MHLKYILSILSLFFVLHLSAQTKLIFHKSHSGSVESFKLALENNSFGLESSNFGAAPRPVIKNATLDSVIYISESLSVMVTSEYCRFREDGYKEEKYWKAGRDTVSNHPLFTKKHSLDSIKNILKTRYYFKNDIDEVKFIGFDNLKVTERQKGHSPLPAQKPSKVQKKKKKEKKIKKGAFVPLDFKQNQPPPYFDILVVTLLAVVLCLALMTGLLARQFNILKN